MPGLACDLSGAQTCSDASGSEERYDACPIFAYRRSEEGCIGRVLYEIEQLLAASGNPTRNLWLNNALLESTLIHVRVLLDFYERQERSVQRAGSDQQEMDDVLVSDYGFPSRQMAITSKDRERLNKDLAHLTYSRTQRTPPDKRWVYKDVVGPVLARSQEFLTYLIDNYVYPDRSDILQECSRLLHRIQNRLDRYTHQSATATTSGRSW